MKSRFFAVVVLLILCHTGWASSSFDLSNLSSWTIVTPGDAIPSEQYAASELQSLLEQTIGVKVPMAAAPPHPAFNLFVGFSPAVSENFPGYKIDDLGEEGLRIIVRPENIVIAGGRPRGTLYGVYEFAERYLGVRFLTQDHTYIPKKSRWKIPCEEWSYVPSFTFRWIYYKENFDFPAFAAKLRINTTTNDEKLGGVTRQNLISHSFGHLMPVEKYGKDHPEYFALVDGERKLEMGGGGPELCVTNPDVIEIVAQNVIKDLDQYPTLQNYSVSQNDNDAYCRCEKCEAINQREGTPMGSNLAFVNAVAERVEKKYPNVKIGTLAYWYTRKAPKTIKPRTNVQIQLCSIECSTLQPLDDPQCVKNQSFVQDMKDWSAICKDIWIWNYNTNFRYYDLPFPNLRVIGPNIRYFLRNNVKGVFMQANGNGSSGEMCELRNYVLSRCLWNPSLDSWKLAQEFCELHYGKAGKTLFRYLDFLHDNAEKAGYEPTCFPEPFELGLTAKSSDKIYNYFQKALAQADDETVRNRVEKASICADRAILETAGQYDVKNGVLRMTYPEKYGDVIQRYKDLTKKHGQTRAEEWEEIGNYYKILDQAAGEGYPAELLENDAWRLVLLPGQNGKIVELQYKSGQRDLLMPSGYKTVRHLFENLTFEELGVKGYANEPAAFTAQKQGDALLLSKTLPDGSALQRKIQLTKDDIRFETRIAHKGDKPADYQLRVHPEYFTGLTSINDFRKIGAYIKGDTWTLFNQDWKESNGPNKDLLKNFQGGEYALYNRKSHYGIQETFDPQKVDKVAFWWSAKYPMAQMDIYSKPATLKPGETYSFEYRISCIRREPK